MGRAQAAEVGLWQLRFNQDGLGVENGAHGRIRVDMLTDCRPHGHDDPGNRGFQFDRGYANALPGRTWPLSQLLLRLVVGLSEGLRGAQVCLRLALGELGFLQFPRRFRVLLAQRPRAPQGLLGLGEGCPGPDGLGLRLGGFDGEFHLQGQDLLLGADQRQELGPCQVRLDHRQHLPRLHGCPKGRQGGPWWGQEMPGNGWGHRSGVSRRHGDDTREPQPLNKRSLRHWCRLGQDFPLLFLEKADAVRSNRLWSGFRLCMRGENRQRGEGDDRRLSCKRNVE